MNLRHQLAFATLLFCHVACGSVAGHDRMGSLADQYGALAASITELKTEVAAAVTALDELPRDNASGARSAFSDLTEAAAEIGPQLIALKQSTGTAQLAAKSHFETWASQNATITDDKLKARANERHSDVSGSLKGLDEQSQKSFVMADGFVASLQDLQKYLTNDLSPAAVGGAADLIARTRGDGDRLAVSLDALSLDVARYAGKLGAR